MSGNTMLPNGSVRFVFRDRGFGSRASAEMAAVKSGVPPFEVHNKVYREIVRGGKWVRG